MKLAKQNYPLYLGSVLSLMLVALAIAGPHLAPRDPVQVMETLTLNGVSYGPPPFRAVPPFFVATYPLGVDLIGRDVLSRLLWAVRPTLILCIVIVLVRVAVGTLFGLIAGWVGGATARVIEGLRSLCIAIPMLAFAIAGILWLRRVENVGAFVIALTLTGWCDTAALIKNQTQTVRHMPYIESARAIGLRPTAVLWRHVLPQFGPVLPVLVAFELTAVTLLVAELGYLGYFVGGGFVYQDPFVNVYVLTGAYPELGQMLSQVFAQLYRTPWVPIFAGMIVVLQLTAFALLGEGLRHRLDVTRPRAARRWRRWSPDRTFYS